MNMFDELNDTNEIIVPSDLETQVKGRIQRRVRKQRVVAALLSSVLVIAFSGVAYAVVTGGNTNSGKINTVDQNKRDGVGVNDNTSTTLGDDTTTSIVTDDNGSTSIITSKRSDDKNDDLSDDDVTKTSINSSSTVTSGSSGVTSTTEVKDENESESEHSGSGK